MGIGKGCLRMGCASRNPGPFTNEVASSPRGWGLQSSAREIQAEKATWLPRIGSARSKQQIVVKMTAYAGIRIFGVTICRVAENGRPPSLAKAHSILHFHAWHCHQRVCASWGSYVLSFPYASIRAMGLSGTGHSQFLTEKDNEF